MNWALEQRQLKPAPWRVLVMLADRHNKDTLRVDPEQALLAHDCNMSRSTVNQHLKDLEGGGLIIRVQRVNPKTQKQMPTFYVLAIDFDNPPEVEHAVSDFRTRIIEVQNGNKSLSHVQNSDTGAVSGKSAIPCPKNRQSRVRNSDTNPVKEPVKEPCVSRGHTQDFVFSDFFEKFTAAYPRAGKRDLTEAALREALGEGADPNQILAAAKAYAEEQKGNARQYIAYSENWVKAKRWEGHDVSGQKVDRDLILRQRAKAIKECQPWVVAHVSATSAREMIELGLITEAECKAAGVMR
ncbi:helix-turn-helix domain-containing protein [Pelagimonas phthalicica]|uniref:helix-turn-helix domain-containing protein n=1 Tax=Pelagimonas phthalicica TaxID=1037362 RepID=UPI0011452C01|nr:helix-turn-helix domain-containing protein [Pelagimonas phthalicica]